MNLDDGLGFFQPTSEIYRINLLKKAEAYKATTEVFDLVEKSAAHTLKTSGAFDITVGPLVTLWRAAGKKGVLPSDAELARARECVGAQYLLLNRNAQTISFAKAGMSLDLGGVAKGYAVDRAIDVLRRHGIKNAIVSCGGDMYCLGRKPYDELWTVGIQHPRKKDNIFLELHLSNKAVTTSGDYERYKIINGKRCSHIIDPRSGYPIGDGVVSATVIANDVTTADIWSTSLCILGEKGLGLAASQDGVDALIVVKDGDNFNVKTTEGFEKRYGHIRKEAIKW